MRWTGNDSPLPFPILFSLRSHFVRSPGFVALSVGAIALSVALATSLEVSTRGVQAELERTADALAGAAEIEVSGGDLGVSEDALEIVVRVPGVLAASPLLRTTLSIAEGPLAGYPLRVLGVDFLSDRKVRDYSISEGGLRVSDPLRLMTDAGAIIITKRLAQRLRIDQGAELVVRVGDASHTLTVRGLLLPGGVADAYGGQVAAMDIYALQEILGRHGWFDQIDVVIEDGEKAAIVQAAIEAELGGIAAVRPAALRGELAAAAFGAIGMAVWIFTCIGVVVAGFLTYSVMSLSVDWRAGEFALLRLAGMEPGRLRWLIRIDGLLVALLGTGLGLAAGVALSGSFFAGFSGFMNQLQRIEPQQPEFADSTILVGLAVGLVVSTIATLEPAYRATSRPALLVLHESGREPVRMTWSAGRLLVLLMAIVVLVLGTSTGLPAPVRLALVYGSCLVLMVGLMGPSFHALVRGLSRLAETAVGGVGVLAGSGLTARPTHTALTVAGLAVASAGLTGVLTVIGSTTQSVSEWIASRSPGGYLITVEDPFGADTRELDVVAHDSVAEIRALDPDVPVSENYVSKFLYQGREVLLIARSYGVIAEHGRVPTVGRDSVEVAGELHAGDVAVSEAFARSFGVEPGEVLELETPEGTRGFRIAALVRGFAGGAGTLLMDVEVFDRFWSRRGASSVVVWPSEPDHYERAVRDAFHHAVFFVSTADYADYAERVFERFSGLVYGVIGLTSLLGALAVMNLLFGGVMERRRELALLRSAGATSAQILGLVLTDALMIAAFGSGAGLLLGLLSTDQMFAILTESLGWTVERRVDWALLGLIGLSITAIAVAASAPPALAASRVPATGIFGR